MWNVIQCAVQGRGHIKSQTPCQDKTFSICSDEMQVIALADGAGSAKLSHYGAETVTKFICSELTNKFDEYFSNNNGADVKQKIISRLLQSLSLTAKQLRCELKDLASTLLFVAVKNGQIMIAHIGDGVIGYLKNDELKIASQPENGEFVNTTVFTTSKDAIMTMKLIKGSLGDISGFVLMSDGTEASLYRKKDHKLADVLKKIMLMSTIVSLDNVQELVKKSFENVIKNATSDDCSIATLVKTKDSFKGFLRFTKEQKCKLLGLHSRISKNTIRRYDDILVHLQEEQTIAQLARKINLKTKDVQKHIDKLYTLNFIEKIGACYHTILIMKTEKKINE